MKQIILTGDRPTGRLHVGITLRYGGFFTGAFVGLACVDLSGYDAKAEFDYFDYRELPDNR